MVGHSFFMYFYVFLWLFSFGFFFFFLSSSAPRLPRSAVSFTSALKGQCLFFRVFEFVSLGVLK